MIKCRFFAQLFSSLVNHAAGKCAIADHSNRIGIRSRQTVSIGKAKGCRNGGGGMAPGAEAVMLTLAAQCKTRDAPTLAQRVKPIAAAGQQLVDIALVTDVKDDVIVRSGENPVQGKGQLHHAKVGGQMAAVGGHFLDQIGAQLRSQRRQLILGQRLRSAGEWIESKIG